MEKEPHDPRSHSCCELNRQLVDVDNIRIRELSKRRIRGRISEKTSNVRMTHSGERTKKYNSSNISHSVEHLVEVVDEP